MKLPIKRIFRFLTSCTVKSDYLYYNFIAEVMKKYIKRSNNNKLIIVFDHTTIEDKFLILQFSLKVGKRTVPLWYKIFKYKEKGNKNFKHIKQGIKELNDIFASYNYEIILLADRGFKSMCLCIAYTWMIILVGADCSKNKKSKIIGQRKK